MVQQQFEDILERITIYQEHNLRGEWVRVGGGGGFSYHITLNPGVTVPTIGSTQKKKRQRKDNFWDINYSVQYNLNK